MPELNLGSALTPVNANNSNALGRLSGNRLGENKDSTNLDQTDFIQLLVAQVKNQDPSKPLEPSQFMNQLAQFSTVNGIQDLNTSFNSLAGQLTSDQALQAAGLVGRNILIPGGDAVIEEGGSVKGSITLPADAADVTVKVVNTQGVEVRTLSMGSAKAGQLQFQWDGFEDDGSVAPAGQYLIRAEALSGSERVAIEVDLEKKVNSVTLGQDNRETKLNLENGSTVNLNDVLAIAY